MCVCEDLFFHMNAQTVMIKNAEKDPRWVGTTAPAKGNNPGGMPTSVRTHDVWRGRRVCFRYAISRRGCKLTLGTTRLGSHRLCLGTTIVLIASPSRLRSTTWVDPRRRVCRLRH